MVVYGIYLHGVVAGMASGQTEYTLDELMWPLAKYCLTSGAPFAVIALLDPASGCSYDCEGFDQPIVITSTAPLL